MSSSFYSTFCLQDWSEKDTVYAENSLRRRQPKRLWNTIKLPSLLSRIFSRNKRHTFIGQTK